MTSYGWDFYFLVRFPSGEHLHHTNMVQRRGYTSREGDVSDFHNKVEKQMFDREYSKAEDIWNTYTYFVKPRCCRRRKRCQGGSWRCTPTIHRSP